MKVVINCCFGGFGLSDEAIIRYLDLKGINYVVDKERVTWRSTTFWLDEEQVFSEYDLDRADPMLVQVVEELGEAANGYASELKIVEVPEEVDWYIEEYDGREHVAERHRTWS